MKRCDVSKAATRDRHSKKSHPALAPAAMKGPHSSIGDVKLCRKENDGLSPAVLSSISIRSGALTRKVSQAGLARRVT